MRVQFAISETRPDAWCRLSFKLPNSRDIFGLRNVAFMSQTVEPPLVDSVLTALYAYVEGDTFRGGRDMALEDFCVAMPEDALASIPGIPVFSRVCLQEALAKAKARATTPLAGAATPASPAPAVTPIVRIWD